MSRRVSLRAALLRVALLVLSFAPVVAVPPRVGAGEPLHAILEVTSPLNHPRVPLDPLIDFGELIRRAGGQGVVDLKSIVVRNLDTGRIVPHALGDDFAYSTQRGTLAFVVERPEQTRYELTFTTADARSKWHSHSRIPRIGVGDLLRYNAGVPRPLTLFYSFGYHDLDRDGTPDLTGTWNYARRPGRPWDGVAVHPGIVGEPFQFGEFSRLRAQASAEAAPQAIAHTYMAADFADWDGDGDLDLVVTRQAGNAATFYRNEGAAEADGMPRFTTANTVSVPAWKACRAVDLDGDGAVDLVVDGHWIRNGNPAGWPFQPEPARRLDAGREPALLDLDGDNRLDAVSLEGGETLQPDFYKLAWRKNLGGSPPRFGQPLPLPGVDAQWVSHVAAYHWQGERGLIVQEQAFAQLVFFRLEASATETSVAATPFRFRRTGRAESRAAVLSLGDQAWPSACDWDGDGDLDLVVGGGYGWPRVVLNQGTTKRPKYAEAAKIFAAGKPIRLVRNELLGPPPNWHDMGYSYPVCVDWDGDGLQDLLCPNETNRIYWFRNRGTPRRPAFSQRLQVLCDDYPDGPPQRRLSAERSLAKDSNNGVYPFERERPFMWRTGAAAGDFNGDGLCDLITHDGHTRNATLFAQYRGADGALRLRKAGALQLDDGRLINDKIVARKAHWTEAFRAVDWNRDGRLDLIYSVAGAHGGTQDGGSIYLLRNVGTRQAPRFAAPETMKCFGEPIRITNHGPHPWAGDFDGDGQPDLIACVEWSVYPFYCHAALMMPQRPKYSLQLPK